MFIKIAFLLTCLLGIGTGIFRCFQLSSNIDQATGFFLAADWTVWLFWILIAGIILLPVAASLSRREPAVRVSRAKLRVQGIFSILLSGCMLYDIYTSVTQGFIVQSIGLIITILTLIAGGLSAFIFLILGVHCLRGKTHSLMVGNLLAIPALWCALRIGVSLVTYATVIPISQRGLSLAFDVLILLFMIGQGRCFLGIHTAKGQRACMMFGLSAAVVGMLATIPCFFYTLTSGKACFGTPDFSTLALSLYALWFSGLAVFSSPDRDKTYFLSSRRLDKTVRFFADSRTGEEEDASVGGTGSIDTKTDM